MSLSVDGITIPDSQLAREITDLVRDTASPLLFHHSSRVYYFGALAGKHRGLKFDPELLYCGCMFHDMGLTHQHSSTCERFEVDGANAARLSEKAWNHARKISIPCGLPLRCIPRRAFLNICTRSLLWLQQEWKWTCWV